MSKIIPLIIFLILAVFVYLLFFSPKKTIGIKIKDQSFNLEVARSVTALTRGLGGRTSLCPDCGMLFVFPFSQTLSFWMKDTLIPLDIIFIDATGTVTDIHTATPEIGTPSSKLKLYQSSRPALYCIELNAGTAQSLSLKVGDTINLHGI